MNGKIEASETTKMLEGWERARMKQLKEYSGSGSRFSVSGSIGLTVEFAILIWEGSLELLSQSYEFNHLEKGEWDKVNSLWNDSYGGLKLSTQNYAYAMALNEEEEEDRVRNKIWKGGGNSEPEKVGANVRNMVQCNAYTFANPEYNEDGSIIAYLSDFNSKDAEDKLACFATLKNGKYVNKDAIEPVTYITDELNNETGEAGADGKLDPVNDAEGNRINRYRDTERTGYGDSTVRIAGTKDFSVATWVRQKSRFPKETGENVTKQDLTAMIHASEICASIWTGDEWSTVQLTDNTSGDINPSVAVSDNYAVVTWRSVEASNSENPLDFNVHDVVNAKIYDRKEQTWSQIYTLYNAHNGSINTVQAGIMNDGTAIAAYTVKTGEEEKDSENSEVMYTTIAKDGSIRPSVRVTNDNNTDKNVQITKINWNVGEHFILGWFKQSNSGQIDEDGNAVMINDIGLLAVDSNGIPSSDFIEDIHTSDTEEVMADFKFVKPSKDATINDLAILWSSTCENESEEITDKNVLIPSSIYTLSEIRFGENGNTITHSVSSEVARMDAGDTIDSFSAYWKGDILQTVLQSTHYEINLNDPSTYTVNEVQKETGTDEEAETEEVYTPIGRTNMYTVTSKLKLCSVETEEPYVDTNAIMGGLTIPVQFTMKNSGIQKVKKLTVNLDGKATDFNVELLPGESTVQAVYYKVPTDGIKNVDYSIVAQGAGVSSRAQDCSGKLELNHPEIAMTDLKMVKEEQKERTIQMSIKNYGNVPLENGGKTVVIQLYDQNPDSSGETDGYGDTEEAEMEAEPIETIEVKDNSELALIDASAYTCQFTLSEKQIDHLLNTKFTEEELKESNYEIPDSEVMLYVKAEVKDEYGESESNDYMYDNQGTVSIQSLAGKYESGTSISTSMEKSDNALDAIVSVKNNYYARKINGNIAAVLKDKNGKIISKVKQSYDSTKEDKGIISIQEESIGEVTIHFTEEDMLSGYTIQDVCSVTARCADADDSNLSAELSDIYVMGQPVETDLFKEYSDADNMSNQKMEVNENGAAVKRTVRVSEKSYYMNGELNKNQLNSVISAFAQNPSNDVELKLNGVTLTKGTGAQMADIKLGKGLTTLTATVFGTVYKQMKVTRKESNGKTASSKKVEYYDLNEDGKAIDVDGSELDLSAEDIVGYEKIYVQNRCKYIANLSKAENVVDSTADKKEETDKTASKRIVNLLLLKAKTTHKSKNQKYSSVLTWNAMNGADGYVVYGAKCNTAKKTYTMKPIKTIKNGRIHTFIHKGLAVNQGYKYMVKAYRLVNGKKKIIQKSYTVRVIVTGSNSKYANPIDIKLDKTSISLVSGKGTKIVAELILPKGKKLRKQGSKIRYISSAPSIATVTKDGRVKGKKKGSCYIYIFTQNGIWKKIKITVKAKKIAKK